MIALNCRNYLIFLFVHIKIVFLFKSAYNFFKYLKKIKTKFFSCETGLHSTSIAFLVFCENGRKNFFFNYSITNLKSLKISHMIKRSSQMRLLRFTWFLPRISILYTNHKKVKPLQNKKKCLQGVFTNCNIDFTPGATNVIKYFTWTL